MARPGIMLYFDMLEPVRVLTDAERGKLLMAMLEYGQSGKVPEFEGMLALAWCFVRPKLDRDGQTYENAKLQRKYAAFCKNRAANNLPKIPFEDWLDMSDAARKGSMQPASDTQRPVDSAAFRYPTATASASTATSTSASTAAAAADEEAAAAAAAESAVNVVGGKLGKNVVFLSQAQMEDMLDRMGLEAFDYYVDKLSSFIIKNDAHVKNHYETMLRWWQEDGRRANTERGR